MSDSVSFRNARCPACGHNVAVLFLEWDRQPLATLGWPASAAQAEAMEKLPLNFVRCVDCGHVYNEDFDYIHVPYSQKPNLMFNQGTVWSGFLSDVGASILDRVNADPVLVEIGHGDGSFLESLFLRNRSGRFVGFDPHGAVAVVPGIELRSQLFDPALHLAELQPDILISRHVLEHLNNPLGFLQSISFAATMLDQQPLAYFEVPCIDRVLECKRTVDFYYEHSSQFTTGSFSRMLESSGGEVLEIGHGYDGEVVYGFVQLGGHAEHRKSALQSELFDTSTQAARRAITSQLQQLADSGRRVAIWGGTGKSAAFMCRYGVDKDRFPVVVDSDSEKVGTHVPGTGQKIRFRDYLLENPVAVLIIPPQWRVTDILAEMNEANISVEEVLIEHDGRLINYHSEPHFYRLHGTD